MTQSKDAFAKCPLNEEQQRIDSYGDGRAAKSHSCGLSGSVVADLDAMSLNEKLASVIGTASISYISEQAVWLFLVPSGEFQKSRFTRSTNIAKLLHSAEFRNSLASAPNARPLLWKLLANQKR